MNFDLKNLIEKIKAWAQTDAIKDININNSQHIYVKTPGTTKYETSCCSLFQLQCNTDATIEEIIYQIERAKKESKNHWKPSSRVSGQRACFVIVTPNEEELRNKLLQLGFVKTYTFPRRVGYPPGMLDMFMLQW